MSDTELRLLPHNPYSQPARMDHNRSSPSQNTGAYASVAKSHKKIALHRALLSDMIDKTAPRTCWGLPPLRRPPDHPPPRAAPLIPSPPALMILMISY